MAKGIAEPEEEFNEPLILDDEMDDLSLDDDALFADLDNEIRLDGDLPEDTAGGDPPGIDLDLNIGGDDAPAGDVLADDVLADDAPADDGLSDLDLDLDIGGDDVLAGDVLADDAPADDGLSDLDLDLDIGGADDDLPDLDISLEAGSAAGGEEAGDLDLDLDGEDMGKLDLELDDAPVGSASGDGLDDLVSGSEDGLDGLLSGSGGADDGLDDLISASEDEGLGGLGGDSGTEDDDLDDLLGGDETGGEIEAAGGDELDDILGDGGEATDDELEALVSESGAGGEDTAGLDVNAFAEGLTLDEDESATESISMEEDLGDLDLSLGPDEVSLDLSDSDSGAGDEELELGDEELEIPPIEEGDPMQAAVADLSLDGVDDLDLDSLDVDIADEEVDAGMPGAEMESFDAAPDMDIDDLDAQIDALDSSILQEELPGEDEELPIEFSQEELIEMGVEEPIGETLEVPSYDSVMEEPEIEFSAVEDVDLDGDSVLELNLDNLESPPGKTYSNVSVPSIADSLELPAMADDVGYGGVAAQAQTIPPQAIQPAGISTDLLLSIPHRVNVEMGSVALKGKDILELDYGSVVPLDRTVGEPVDLVLEGKAIAQGEIVLINGKNLGVRIVAVSK